MALIITPKSKIEEYFQSERLSQSELKALAGGLFKYLDYQSKKEDDFYYSEGEALLIGSAVDTKLTGEDGQFEKEYYISDQLKPGEAVMSVIHEVFDLMLDWFNNEKLDINKPSNYNLLDFTKEYGDSLENYNEYVINACNNQSYCKSMSEEVRISRIINNSKKEGKVGDKELINSYGKTILSPSQNEIVNNVVRSLRIHFPNYFERDLNKIGDNAVDIYYQLPIYFTYRGVACKALLDIVVKVKSSDGSTQLIIPVDLKTMSESTLNFISSLKRFRYDIILDF